MGRFATTVLKGLGVLLLVFIALSAIATIVGFVLSIVATAVSIVVSLVILALVVLAAVGLWSLVRDEREPAETDADRHPSTPIDDRDPEQRLRDSYVAGEIDDDEFERRLDLLLETEDTASALERLEADRSSDRESDRTRLWDR